MPEPKDGSETADAQASGAQDLYIGLVRAIGTDLGDTIEALRICFGRAGYAAESVVHIKLSEYLPILATNPAVAGDNPIAVSVHEAGRFQHYMTRMDAGDWVREHYDAGILAQCAIAHARSIQASQMPETAARLGRVFIFDSLMHKDEVAVLRSTYGKRLFVLAVHSTALEREEHLLDALRSADPEEKVPGGSPHSAGDGSADLDEQKAFQVREARRLREVELLMKRDEGLSDPSSPHSPAPPKLRVSVRKTFALADVFVSASEAAAARKGDHSGVLERFVEKVFDEPFHTPTRDELGMAHAYVAARRSGSLARNVGAALCTTSGEVLAVGTNEVPAAEGGQYWPVYDGDERDERDHVFRRMSDPAELAPGFDSNDQIKLDIAVDFTRRLLSALPNKLVDAEGQLPLFEEYAYMADELIPKLLEDPEVATAKLFDVIEYSRQVHAEMAALMSCARRGISTQDTVLYCTTFPCHECSRHIVAAGVSRVVYVEPYEKSRVSELHYDSVDVELYAGRDPKGPGEAVPRVRFVPFLGVSPDRHATIYSPTRRKLEARTSDPVRVGRARHWQLGPGSPIRTSIATDLEPVGVAELMTIAATADFITRALESRYGLTPAHVSGEAQFAAFESADTELGSTISIATSKDDSHDNSTN